MVNEDTGLAEQTFRDVQNLVNRKFELVDNYLPSVVLGVLLLYILALFVSFLGIIQLSDTFTEMGSVLATFLLILIYLGMKQDQRRMKELQEDQIVINKEKNSPSLFVLDYGYKKPDNHFTSDPGKDYHPYFTIKNLGNTTARYLQIEVVPELMVWTGHESGLEILEESGLEKIVRPLLSSKGDPDKSVQERTGISLEPGQQKDFWIPVDFSVKNNDEGYFALPDSVEEPNPLRPYEMTKAAALIEAHELPGIPPNNDYFDDGLDIRNDDNERNQGLGIQIVNEEGLDPKDIPFERLQLTISFRHLLTKDFSELHGEHQHSNFTLILPLNAIDGEKLEQDCSGTDLDLPMCEWDSEQIWSEAMEMEQYETRKYEALSAKRSNTAYDLEVDLIENNLRNTCNN